MSENVVKHLLIAPLDWGLGHTTRCVPIIRYLLQLGHKIILAGNDVQLSFYKTYFPDCEQWLLKGYNIYYGRHSWSFAPAIVRQIPKILRTIKYENQWLREKIAQNKIDGVIADNRYGLHHSSTPCVIITHQLRIMTGMDIFDGLLQKLHYRYLQQFGAVWVADQAKVGLAGSLSHPSRKPHNHQYLGVLSQFEDEDFVSTDGSVLILLSGPEPQRSILAVKLWRQATQLKRKVVFVEGSNHVPPPADIPNHIDYYKKLPAAALLPLIQKAAIIVCRSGYSTLMDLVTLQKKAIIIPTPGQTEQEYLAKCNDSWFCKFPQQDFSLAAALDVVKDYDFKQFPLEEQQAYKLVIDRWLCSL